MYIKTKKKQDVCCVAATSRHDQDAKPGEITDETGKSIARAKPVAEYMMHILENGGIKPLLQKQLQS